MDKYSELKDEVLQEATKSTFNLDRVKEFFKDDINSLRALSKVSTLEDIIQLLEDRDVLNMTNVMSLFHLGRMINNQEIQDLAKFYNKICLVDTEIICDICKISCEYLPPHTTVVEVPSVEIHCRSESESTENLNSNNDDETAELDEAVENLAVRLGKHWKYLAPELHLKESQIDTILFHHPDDPVQQARQAMTTWRLDKGPAATLKELDRALNARLCRIKGLSSELRLHVYGTTY